MKPPVAWRIGAALVASAFLASCSSSGPPLSFKRAKEYFSERDYGPASPRMAEVGPMPKGGGHAVVGDAYQVAGQTFVPKEDPVGYSATGLASWYGDAFHGRLTANGEVYDVNGLTAAHPTLPLPSYVRVTNLENGRSILVRVNDRGPFARGRLIDVSERVADMLDFRGSGTAEVRVDYMGPARLDGLDENKLLASYRDPNAGGGVMYALNKPARPAARPQPQIMLASAIAAPRPRPVPLLAPQPALLLPAYAASNDDYGGDDVLGPLILRSGFVNSYAEQRAPSAATRAVEAMAGPPDLKTALDAAAKRKARELGLRNTLAVVQLGSFENDANAAHATASFGRYGAMSRERVELDGRLVTVVSIALDPSVDPGTVVTAAAAAGLSDARVLAN